MTNLTLSPLSIGTNSILKRLIKKPAFSMLNEGQAGFIKYGREFEIHPTAKYLVLEGWAGTGKTFVGSMFIEDLLHRTIGKIKIAMTAPVNKAVRVLKNSAEFEDDRLVYGTLHSLLGLKAQLNKKTGQLEFKRNPHQPCVLESCTWLVVDESSMQPDDLFEMVHDLYVSTGKLKVLFIGDGGQIPPINQDYSIPFDISQRDHYGIWFYELTHIVRQAEGNPIIQFTTKLRKKLHSPNPIVLFDDNIDEKGSGVLFLGGNKQAELGSIIRKLFTSKQFRQNPDFAKIICWRNVYVKAFNKLVRGMLFGKDVPKVVVGEKMVATDVVLEGYDRVIMTNSTEFEILELSEDMVMPIDGLRLKFYAVKIMCDGFEEDSIRYINIVHEDSEQTYKDTLARIYEVAIVEPDGQIRGQMFNKYWELKRLFAGVDYNYAITAHRSQGSTYQYALVIMEDIYGGSKRMNVKDRNRIGYTACTRPKDMLIMVGDL